jgi:cyclophilin family peptidyl-prolyl cis-trans isomerase/HEAT repeat protein
MGRVLVIRRVAVVVLFLCGCGVLPLGAQDGPSMASQGPADPALALAVDRLLHDRLYPPTAQPAADLSADWALLRSALLDTQSTRRAAAVRALGRFEDPEYLPDLKSFLSDGNATVRREAANAIAMAVRQLRGSDVDRASAAIESVIRTTNDTRLYVSLGSLPYEPAWAMALLARLTKSIDPWPPTSDRRRFAHAVGALDAIEGMLAHNPALQLDARTVAALRRPARYGLTGDPNEPSLTALRALATHHVRDNDIAANAVRFRCPRSSDPLCGWQTRQAAVALIDALDAPDAAPAIAAARKDPSYMVRLELLRQLAPAITRTHKCRVALDALRDPSLQVQFAAMSYLSPDCDEKDEMTAWLKPAAADYGEHLERAGLAARALLTLTAIAPDQALPMLQQVQASDRDWHGVWIVRAAVATAAGLLLNEPLALRYVDDEHPNVREAALRSLVKMQSPKRVEQALRMLESPDYALVRTAAAVLQRAEGPQVVTALVAALDRMTAGSEDTSREARLAIFERLEALARPGPNGVIPLYYYRDIIEKYLADFDPRIAEAAANVMFLMRGARPVARPTRRAPQQPVEDDLRRMPSSAVIYFNIPGTALVIRLMPDEAPLAVARFAALVRHGTYDGNSVYYLAPLGVLVAGSRADNDLAAEPRFLRDEIGLARHSAGAIGMMTHGRHSAAAQWFIDMGDAPQYDFDYTVFARVMSGQLRFQDVPDLHALADVVEGTRITRIELGSDIRY